MALNGNNERLDLSMLITPEQNSQSLNPQPFNTDTFYNFYSKLCKKYKKSCTHFLQQFSQTNRCTFFLMNLNSAQKLC